MTEAALKAGEIFLFTGRQTKRKVAISWSITGARFIVEREDTDDIGLRYHSFEDLRQYIALADLEQTGKGCKHCGVAHDQKELTRGGICWDCFDDLIDRE